MNHSRRSLQKSDVSDSLVFWEQIPLSLFRSQKYSNLLEQIFCFNHVFAITAKSDLLPLLFASLLFAAFRERFESIFRSFAHKKQAIRTKNQRANCQPCPHAERVWRVIFSFDTLQNRSCSNLSELFMLRWFFFRQLSMAFLHSRFADWFFTFSPILKGFNIGQEKWGKHVVLLYYPYKKKCGSGKKNKKCMRICITFSYI